MEYRIVMARPGGGHTRVHAADGAADRDHSTRRAVLFLSVSVVQQAAQDRVASAPYRRLRS